MKLVSILHHKHGFNAAVPVLVATSLLLTLGCGPSVLNVEAPSRLAPADLHSCVVREFARMNYTVLAADREAGILKAEKKTSSAFMDGFSGKAYFSEITALILPARDGAGPTLRITLQTSGQEGGGTRSSSGLTVSSALKKEGAALQSACAG